MTMKQYSLVFYNWELTKSPPSNYEENSLEGEKILKWYADVLKMSFQLLLVKESKAHGTDSCCLGIKPRA